MTTRRDRKTRKLPSRSPPQQEEEKKKHSWDNTDRAAQRAAYRKLLFTKKQSEFLFRYPGQLNGKDFAINFSNDCQLYVHDHIAQCFVDKCERSEIVIGPTKSSIFIRDCKDSKFSIFCQQLRMRDCHNLEVQLYSQTEPVVESCTNIKFLPQVYAYPELFSQMRPCVISPWTNNWTDVFDFTPNKTSPDGLPNYFTVPDLEYKFIRPLEEAKDLLTKASLAKGSEVKSLNDIGEEDLEEIEIQLAPQPSAPTFSLGDYFDNYSENMLRTVPPTKLVQTKQIYKHSFFLVCFVASFDAIFDSVIAEEAGETDLSNTLLYKLMTICGTFLKANEGKKQRVGWIEQTRSSQVTLEQKQQLCETMGDRGVIDQGEQSNCMAIGIHFRMKGLTKGDPKTIKQLRSDGQALQNEHPDMVCFSEHSDCVTQSAELMFRSFNQTEKGHAMGGQ